MLKHLKLENVGPSSAMELEFLFEDVTTAGRRPDKLYPAEVEQCVIYLGLFGNEYGYEK